jgi:hypothetical protein
MVCFRVYRRKIATQGKVQNDSVIETHLYMKNTSPLSSTAKDLLASDGLMLPPEMNDVMTTS